MSKTQKIFVVDDDPPMNTMICKFVESQGYQNVTGFFAVEEMIPNLSKKEGVIIIQDYDLPGMSGLECIKEIKPKFPKVEFIFLSGQRSIQIAIDAIKFGAFDYIIKDNFAKDNVGIKIKNLLRIKDLEKKRVFIQKLLIGLSLLLLLTVSLLLFTLKK